MEPTAEGLFEEHLRRIERDEPSDLEQLCTLHPEFEQRLLELAQGWERFSEQVDRLEQGLSPDLEVLQSYPEHQRELQTLLDLWPVTGTLAQE